MIQTESQAKPYFFLLIRACIGYTIDRNLAKEMSTNNQHETVGLTLSKKGNRNLQLNVPNSHKGFAKKGYIIEFPRVTHRSATARLIIRKWYELIFLKFFKLIFTE